MRELTDALERKASEMAHSEQVCVAELASIVRDFLYTYEDKMHTRARDDSQRREEEKKKEEKAARDRKESEAKQVREVG